MHSVQRQWRGCNNTPSFLQRTAPIVLSFCKSFTQHDVHILVTVPFCCDQKVRAASAQSFTLWQQATIEFTCHDHSIIACSCHTCGDVLRTHSIRGELRIQHNTSGEVATILMNIKLMYLVCLVTYAILTLCLMQTHEKNENVQEFLCALHVVCFVILL